MNLQDVENLAELARLDISQVEKESLIKDFEGILGYVQQIESVVIDEEVISGNEYAPHNAWREDEEVVRDFSLDSIKEQFPEAQGDFLKVKKIL